MGRREPSIGPDKVTIYFVEFGKQSETYEENEVSYNDFGMIIDSWDRTEYIPYHRIDRLILGTDVEMEGLE